jgi:hypothetical protein
MQRFKKGDPVFILPRFAHLYPDSSGIVIATKDDPFRPMFNSYTLQFPDRSTGNLFEFQIIENPPNYTTLIAVVAFDSQRDAPQIHMRGQGTQRQIVLQTPANDVHLKVQASKTRASIMGQVLERRTKSLLRPVEVSLMKEATTTNKITSDSEGIFKFSDAPRGTISILLVIPEDFFRILGEISI